MKSETADKTILCPSAQPENEGARVFGVQTGSEPGKFRVGYLTESQPITPEIIASTGHARPAEVLRIAAPCMGGGCAHFDGASCMLATRVASMLNPVVRGLPRCAIRPTCRWFKQEGPAACVRCPQVVTENRDPNELQRTVSGLPPMTEPNPAAAPA